MSKDIRSYFIAGAKPKTQTKTQPNPSTKRKALSIEDDDDVIPPTPSPIKEKKDKKRKRKMVVSDSDDSDDTFVNTKKLKEIKPSPKKEKDKKQNAQKRMKEVKPSDVFGNGPIQRTVIPKKSSDIVKKETKTVTTEIGIHSDDSFDKTLLELDEGIEIETETLTKSLQEDTSKNLDFKIKNSNVAFDDQDKQKTNGSDKESVLSVKDKKKHNKSPIKSDCNANKDNVKVIFENEIFSKKSPNTASKSSPNKNAPKGCKKSKDFTIFTNSSFDETIDDETSKKASEERDKTSSPASTEKEKKSRKRKISESEEKTPEELDAEKIEKKRFSAMLYKNYLNRSGPKHHGKKEIPEGAPNCLKGLVFLITGVLDSFTKEEIEDAVSRYGGEVKKGISGKVTHLIYGEDAGPAKLAKAEKFGTSIISEDEFLDLIKSKSEINHVSPKDTKVLKTEEPVPKKEKSSSKNIEKNKNVSPNKKIEKPKNTRESPRKKPTLENLKKASNEKIDIKIENSNTSSKSSDIINDEKLEKSNADKSPTIKTENVTQSFEINQSWVDKYRPSTMKQIIGQHGDKSCANKLHSWLTKWYKNRRAKLPPPNPWSKGDGGYYKAVLLSGSPGVGKTTTVSVVCKELGYDTVEFNASDTRSKNLIKEHITEITTTNSLLGFVKGNVGKGAVSKKHAIIMDEVDGMAGNEDRGGMQELINLIKSTEVPIICICNDKSSPKMRSLINYCFDIPFSKPKVEQIKAAMMSICFKEGVKISPKSLEEIIIGASQDVRQILNVLSMWSASEKNISSETASHGSKSAKKDIKMGPWAVCRSVFSHEEHKNMTIHDKSDLFFHDYSLGPLYVQHNYLKVIPKCPKNEVLDRFAETANSLSIGDLVENKIRRNMAWSLLPTQAMYCSVIPGTILSGSIQGQIDFPGWLGQNSRTNKLNRLAQEICSHTRLSTSGSKQSIRLDYASHILDAALNPLINDGLEGVSKTIDILQEYHLLKDDISSLIELTKWPGQKDKNALIETKVKSALTRKYNKDAVPLPYSVVSVKKNASSVSKDSGYDEFDSENAEQLLNDEDENSDMECDAMIKKKKSKTADENDEKPSKNPSKSKGKSTKGQSVKKSSKK